MRLVQGFGKGLVKKCKTDVKSSLPLDSQTTKAQSITECTEIRHLDDLARQATKTKKLHVLPEAF